MQLPEATAQEQDPEHVWVLYSESTRRLHKRATHASRETWAGQQGRPLRVTHATTERQAGGGTPLQFARRPQLHCWQHKALRAEASRHTVKLCILGCNGWLCTINTTATLYYMLLCAEQPQHKCLVVFTAQATVQTRPQQQLYSHWRAAAAEPRPSNA